LISKFERKVIELEGEDKLLPLDPIIEEQFDDHERRNRENIFTRLKKMKSLSHVLVKPTIKTLKDTNQLV
jgi:hypothetical protein